MYLDILKKDLKRKKTMNVILLLFIILAVMFVASGLNNVMTVANGTDYYLDKAGVGDYVIITMGDNSIGNIAPVLEKTDCVKGFKIETCIFGSQDNIKHADGSKVETKNTSLFQSISDTKLKFFDKNNEEITAVNRGEVIPPVKFLKDNGFEIGDSFIIKLGENELKLKIAGSAKDALLGSKFMGNTRLLINEEDYNTFLSDENIKTHYLGEIAYIETDDPEGVRKAASDIPKIAFEGTRSLLNICYVMDMIIAIVVVILSICLMIVSFVVLRFSIGFTITEEYREIGVMKAIGLKNRKIRGLYIVKYLMLSVIGGVIGLIASIPFGNMLLASVSENMVLGNDAGILPNIISTAGTIIFILLFAYSCTGKVKKLTPIDAIRSGNTGERFVKKSRLRLKKGNSRPAFFMALNDILSAPKRFMTVMITFFLTTLLVLILVNTTATMKSANLVSTFGTKSDIYINNVEIAMKYMNTGDKDDTIKQLLDTIESDIEGLGYPCKASVDIKYTYKVISNGNEYSIACAQSKRIKADEYSYFEGTAPQRKNEIAITPQVSELTGAKIGDTLTIDFGSEKTDCVVTGHFETMNNMGELIRFSDEAPTDMAYVSGLNAFQVDFNDNPTEAEIENRKEKIKEFYDNDKIFNAAEFCMDCVAVVPTLEAVQFLLLGITIVVIILVTILVERSFISDEHSQIAILKAIGFKTSTVVSWHVIRFGVVALAAAILAGAVSIPMTDLIMSPVFGMMGARHINYYIDPLQIFLIYPAVIFAATVFVAWLTALYTKKIKASEATNIE